MLNELNYLKCRASRRNNIKNEQCIKISKNNYKFKNKNHFSSTKQLFFKNTCLIDIPQSVYNLLHYFKVFSSFEAPTHPYLHTKAYKYIATAINIFRIHFNL